MGKSPAAVGVISLQTSNKVPLPGTWITKHCISSTPSYRLQTGQALAKRVNNAQSALLCPASWHTMYNPGTSSWGVKPASIGREVHCTTQPPPGGISICPWRQEKDREACRRMKMYGSMEEYGNIQRMWKGRTRDTQRKMYWQAETKEEDTMRASFKTAGNGALKPYRNAYFLVGRLKGWSEFLKEDIEK